MGLFDIFGSKKKREEQETMNLMKAVVKHQVDMRLDAVDSDVLPNGYGSFGLSVTNPIPTHSAKGSNDYISKLRTIEGRPVVADRIGSTSAPVNVTKAMIDIYGLNVDGQNIATIYICPYHKANSSKAPEGFTLLR